LVIETSGNRWLSSCRILLVDADAIQAHSTGLLLGLMGHQVKCAHGAAEAVKVAAQFRPDIVLIDLSMSGTDAISVAHAIRETDAGHLVRLAALTESVSADTRVLTQGGHADTGITHAIRDFSPRHSLPGRAWEHMRAQYSAIRCLVPIRGIAPGMSLPARSRMARGVMHHNAIPPKVEFFRLLHQCNGDQGVMAVVYMHKKTFREREKTCPHQ
jgi:CheY-like chemotaxis protein